MLKIFVLASCMMLTSNVAHSKFNHFITREDSVLKDGHDVLRFAGLHAPELHRIEDDERGICKADRRGWGHYSKWPTKDEQQNWIRSLVLSGQKATRIYVFSVAHPDDVACQREAHILPPYTPEDAPRLNEHAMKVFDRMLAIADREGLRIIVPFIDHWSWWGGRAELAAFYGETADDFYDTNSKTYQAYLSVIKQIISRTNTITGRKYSEEKAVMAWETGNELKNSTTDFVTQTAALIKKLAPHQLVVDGNYLSVLQSSVHDPNIDIISNHFYSVNHNNKSQTIIDDLNAIGGKKAYIVGEFGLIPTKQMQSILQTAVGAKVKGAQTSGALVWGFRGRRHNGGFYWHKEGSTDYYSYHLPGFPEGKGNDEIAVIDTVRKAQANMLGLPELVPLPLPEAPKLRAIKQGQFINWLGSPVGRAYRVERKRVGAKEWKIIGEGISDGSNRYDSRYNNLFQDKAKLKANHTYLYRVIASNESGDSLPSNIQALFVTTST